jgi:NAD-dependent deacetylase
MPLDHTFHKLMADLPDSLSRARYAIQTFPDKVVIFTGAGISAESGINTFRDHDGEWEKYDPSVMSSMDGFMENPALVWGWYIERLMKAMDAQPNAGHLALAMHDYPVITQNVDLLHEKAGSSKVLHMHGQGDKAKCTECNWTGHMTDLSLQTLKEGHLPQCPKCGGLARPDVVWFGEMLNMSNMIDARALITGSICIVVGTSGVVEPVASFPQLADLVISVNLRDEDHMHGSLKLTGKAGDMLPKLFA